MKIGGHDRFGPNASKMEEWKRDPAVESAMLIGTAVHEQSKIQKKTSSSSSTRPARSLTHQSPLDALSSPRSLDSYRRPPGPPYCWDLSKNSASKYQNKLASNKSRSAPSKSNFQAKDLQSKPSPQSKSNFRSGGGTGPAKQDRDHKDNQQSRPFNPSKKGRGGGSGQRLWDRSASSGGEADLLPG